LNAAFRGVIDRATMRASAEYRRAERPAGGSLWGRDYVFTRTIAEDGTLVVTPVSSIARELFLSRLAAEEGATLDDVSPGRYRVTLEGGESFDLRIRPDRASAEALVDGWFAEGLDLRVIEGNLLDLSFSREEILEILGDRVSRTDREGRSEGELP
jgi:hypothetical protein